MNTLLTILLAVCLALFAGCLAAIHPRRRMTGFNAYGGTRMRHESLTRKLESAVSQRYLLATEGAAEGGADICGLDDRPIGFFNDEGGIGDSIAIERGSHKTHLGIAAVAVTIGAKLYTAAGGKVSTVAASDSFFVGVARTAVAAGDATLGGDSAIVEYEPAGPVAAAEA
jgi:hypothetical protein